MCGIIGFIGNDALNGILNGLELLEYRGYDSAGFAIRRAGESLPERVSGVALCEALRW